MAAKVVVLMSGGVDSSVAALLLHQQGYSVTGVTMRLLPAPLGGSEDPRLCCTARALADAGEVARRIGIRHEVVDIADDFFQAVIEPFVAAYRAGETPNPCVSCNRVIKFGIMLARARQMGADFIATGHYARVVKAGDDWGLYRALDQNRDQSYFLCGIPAPCLSNTLFPLGEWTKEAVRRFAKRHHLPVADRPQSQEACFAGGGDYRFLVGEDRPGKLVHIDGRVLGSHRGISHFTIGQRRGLGLGGGGDPLYVTRIVPETSTVYVGPHEGLERSNLLAEEPNYFAPLSKGQPVEVKIRSQMEAVRAGVVAADADRLEVTFERPVTAVTPGQFAVLYDGDRLLAGARVAA